MGYQELDVLTPLSEFRCDLEQFDINDFCSVVRCREKPELPESLNHNLSEYDHEILSDTPYWLHFHHNENEQISAAEKVNLFLLSLWVVKPTKTHAKFRFGISEDRKYGGISRYLDRFLWIRGNTHDEVSKEDLERLSSLIRNMVSIVTNHQRLHNALHLTHQACMAFKWQPAFICFSSAMEAILTYSKKHGITQRIAETYALLTKAEGKDKEKAVSEVKRLYGIRSDIVHGRAAYMNDADRNIEELTNLTNVIRRLWDIVLSSDDILTELEKSDRERAAWFNSLGRSARES
ncbi:MAG: hypothetical protein HF981_07380 [Desulfobacteraceae bacterium]|nr:hypothetical protein [Desulfobacteraceae bacterium]MBC2750190.1 hypothetical protein [Desulfobacteraceae bacterium]